MMSALKWFPAESFVVDAVDERLFVYHSNTEIYLAFVSITILLPGLKSLNTFLSLIRTVTAFTYLI